MSVKLSLWKKGLQGIYADLRKNEPELFKAHLASASTIDEIRLGYNETSRWALPGFTMDDWFDCMGEDWQTWILPTRANFSSTYDYVCEQAKARGYNVDIWS